MIIDEDKQDKEQYSQRPLRKVRDNGCLSNSAESWPDWDAGDKVNPPGFVRPLRLWRWLFCFI